ncbi:MAG: hypothetical protein LC657_02060 [Desulfobacteraceae bacterium]|nr:hypothetical protein [Desulfobacteraceae bacterium]
MDFTQSHRVFLSASVKALDAKTERLSERTIDIDKRVVRLETFVEVGQGRQKKIPGKELAPGIISN